MICPFCRCIPYEDLRWGDRIVARGVTCCRYGIILYVLRKYSELELHQQYQRKLFLENLVRCGMRHEKINS